MIGERRAVIAEDHGLFKRGDLALKIGIQPDELLHDLSLMVAEKNIYWVKMRQNHAEEEICSGTTGFAE